MTFTHLSTIPVLCLMVGCQSLSPSATPPCGEARALASPLAFDESRLTDPHERPDRTTVVDASGKSSEASESSVNQVAYVQPTEPSEELLEPEPIPQSVEPATTEMSLEELEGIALKNNPALGQALARVEAAQGTWVQTGLPPNPVVGYSGQQLGSGGEAEQQGVFLGQEIVTGKKLKLNREAASWEVDRAQREFESVQLRVLTDVRIGYYDVLIAQRRLELATELVRINDQGVEAAEALFESKEVSEADPLRARVEADTAGIFLQNAINQHAQAWRQLAAVLGTPDLPIQKVHGELKADDIHLTWDETLQQIVNESPEIAAAMAEVQAANWGVERAYAEVIPNIEVQAVIQDDRGTGSSNANLQISLPIPILNRNQGGIRRAHAQAAVAEQAVARIGLDLQVRLASAFQRYESAHNQVHAYSQEDGILDKTNRSLELVRKGYEGGEVGVQDLLSVQRTYFQTNLAYLDSVRELWVSMMEIRGLLLLGSLTGGQPSDR